MLDESRLKALWEDERVTKVSYNAAYEIVWLSYVRGWTIKGPVFDPLIAAYLLDENLDGYSLQSVSTRLLSAPEWKLEWEPYRKTLAELSFLPSEYESPLRKYNEQDIYWTRQLYSYLKPRLESSKLSTLFSVEMQNLKTLARMTEWGIKIDLPLLQEWTEKYAHDIQALRAEFNFNPSSPLQVLRELRRQGFVCNSTSAEVLAELEGDTPRQLLRFRHLEKIHSTYLTGLQGHIYLDGRIHPSFHQHRTVSGRLSSSHPNGQNFPRDTRELAFRKLFRGTWAKLVRVDFNQLELRVAGHYGGGRLLDVYRAGEDIHSATGERIWSKRREQITENERVVAKVTNFTALYDPFRTAVGSVRIQCAQAGIELSWSDAQDIIESFRRAYPEWWLFYARALRQVYDTGQVRASSGRGRRSPLSQGQLFPYGPPPLGDFKGFFAWCGQYDKDGKRLEQEVLRSIVNSLDQGLGADITKLVGTVIDRTLQRNKLRSRLCNNVHDELLIDCAEGEEEQVAQIAWETSKYPPVRTAFGFALQCPLEVTIGMGPTWSDTKNKENEWKPNATN